MGNQSAPPYRVFSVEELEEATENFDQSTFLGEGSIGKVFHKRYDSLHTTLSKGFIKFISLVVPATKIMY